MPADGSPFTADGWRPRVRVRMALLLSALCLLSSVPAGAQERLGRRVDSTFAFGRNGWVDVSVSGGTVIVNGWTRPEARVRGRAESGVIEAELINGRIAITVRPDRNARNRRLGDVTIEIDVPVGTRVMASTAGGDIRVRGTQAEVQANSAGGDIEVVDATERVKVTTAGGDIRVEKSRGRTEIGTSGGDVELYDIVGPLQIRSVSSDLVLRAVESSDVRISTTSGDITYQGVVDSKGTYEITAHSGDVHFAVPEGTGAALSLQTYNGDINSDFRMTLMPGSNLRKTRGQRMEFDIGGGGARIRIETFSGDITIGRGPARRERE
jgi:DUF4097 and DUF4098 domain-containing protein YvlB